MAPWVPFAEEWTVRAHTAMPTNARLTMCCLIFHSDFASAVSVSTVVSRVAPRFAYMKRVGSSTVHKLDHLPLVDLRGERCV